MNRKGKQALFGCIIACVIIVGVIGFALFVKYSPSKERKDLKEYYPVKDNEVLIIMQNEVHDRYGILENDVIYVDYNTIYEYLNQRMYWDSNENLLVYTTPTEIIKVSVDTKEYTSNEAEKSETYEIVKIQNGTVYIAFDFVKEYSDFEYSYYDSPNRIVVDYQWGEYLVAQVKKKTQLRVEPDSKSDILLDLDIDQKLTYLDINEVFEGDFVKVITEDGVIGYVKNRFLQESSYEELKSVYIEPEYTNITKDYIINMVWHQVTNMDANGGIGNLLQGTKGVTTVSPTWYKIVNNEGEISSLASAAYVEKVHDLGMEVWALVDDFSTEVNMYDLLSSTSRRERLSNALITEAIQYNLDGINLDFENISYDAGIHYIQFIRELSVKCRTLGIVLSVDNYVPSNYTVYYNREEQGIVVDYVVIMSYDEHHGGSDVSGSVASIGFVQQAIDDTLTMVPKEKVIMGIPFYTRQWEEVTQENGEVTVSSSAYSMTNAEALFLNNGIEPVWDNECGQYYGEYEKDGALYKIWLEDIESIEEKLKRISDAKVAGIACWKLGLEKETIWDMMIKYLYQ